MKNWIFAPWASYQIRKIAGYACAGNAGNIFPRRPFQRKPLVSDPGMHHGTCVTRAVMHVGIAYLRWRGKRSRHSRRMRTRNFVYLARGPCDVSFWIKYCIYAYALAFRSIHIHIRTWRDERYSGWWIVAWNWCLNVTTNTYFLLSHLYEFHNKTCCNGPLVAIHAGCRVCYMFMTSVLDQKVSNLYQLPYVLRVKYQPRKGELNYLTVR